MKQNLYLFSNTILRKKDNTLLIETSPLSEAAHKADIENDDFENLLIPAPFENGETKKYIPAENVEAIYSFGLIKFNSQFLSFLGNHQIPLHIFNYYGNYIGSFIPKSDISAGNILINQVANYLDPIKRLYIAKKFVRAAGLNAIANLKYYAYRGVDLSVQISNIQNLIDTISSIISIEQLFGIEGNIKSNYYSCWSNILRQDLDFHKRVQRPPDNIVNCLLSFGNVVFYGIVLTEIFRTGLSPAIGYLHSPGNNRNSLSFDIAEIFKPVIVDKVIFRTINTESITDSGFIKKNNLLYMKEETKKIFIKAIEDRLKTTFLHTDLKRNITYKTLIRLECYSLIKYLRGLDDYVPFLYEP